MKMESIKSKKFNRFEKNEILNAINVVGGKVFLTKKGGSSSYSDCWDDSTGNDVKTTDGSQYDACDI